MAIQAQLADGRVLEFPDGTDPQIIQATVKRLVGVQDAGIDGDRVAGQLPPGTDTLPQPGGAAQPGVREEGEQRIQGIPAGAVQALSGFQQFGKPSGVVAEPLAAVATGAIAEPAAGLAGIVQAINPLAEPGAGARAVEATREALTFQPRAEEAQEVLGAVGEAVEPVAEKFAQAEKGLGDFVFDKTGSPALAALATTLPTAIAEFFGFSAGKGAIKASRAASKAVKEGKIAVELSEAVPSIEQLKDTSRAVYKEIDDLGASVSADSFTNLVDELKTTTRNAGIDPDITPKAAKALRRFDELVGQDVSLSELDTLRKVAQNAASSLEKAESSMGLRIIDTVDQFLDKASVSDFTRIEGPTSEISKRYKTARDLWGRARRSELLEDAFERARLQASGFENGIRIQFRQILNNKKQKRFFNPEERTAMKRVIEGTKKENFARLVGKLGFSEGGATNFLGASIGIGGGAFVGGPVGAVIVPAIGQISRKLAQKMTAKNAEFADQVIRAGKDGKKITAAYIRNTPKGLRDPAELSELLMRPDIDLDALPDTPLINNAARIATENRAALGGVLAQVPEEEQ